MLVGGNGACVVGFLPGVWMVPGVVHRWCGSRASFVLRMWVGAMFLLALLFLWVEIRLQSKLLDENVCACELAVHFGWGSARPPC